MKSKPSTNLMFFLFSAIVFISFYGTLRDLVILSLNTSPYNHIVLIPFVSGYFIISERKKIFSDTDYSKIPGISLIGLGLLILLIGKMYGLKLKEDELLSIQILSFVTLWSGGFVFFYGARSFRKALFPLLFLIFLIPIPAVILDKIISILTKASAEVCSLLFNITGVPVYRDGAVFHIPGLVIEVAKQCSGIRSSTVLFVTSVITGHMFLKTGWRKCVLALSVFPITVFKNGLRIVTITLLSAYVDRGFLSGSLHRSGGIPFFVLALVFLGIVLAVLVKSEKKGLKETGLLFDKAGERRR
ncbi:MAG: exosortase [Deltaproteobacteria bacterium]|nr:exosortase [Deltaproteobacteria bacterium]